MKTLKLFLFFFLIWVGAYFLLSTLGLLFYNDETLQHMKYWEIIGSQNWFFFYIIFFGWWIAGFPASEYYNKLFKS